MKTAIYIENGLTQFVLTPETEIDKKVLEEIAQAGPVLKTIKGSFYHCSGGYIRQASHFTFGCYNESRDESLIFVIDHAAKPLTNEDLGKIALPSVDNPMGLKPSTAQPFVAGFNLQIDQEDERR